MPVAEPSHPSPSGPPEVAPRTLAVLWFLTVAVFALHNLEEYLRDLPAWAAVHAPPWIAALHSGRAGYGIAVALLTGAALVVAVIAVATRARWSAETLVCAAFVLLINAAGHLVFGLATLSAMPGALTSPLLIGLGIMLVLRLPRVEATRGVVLSTAAVAVLALVGSLALGALLSP